MYSLCYVTAPSLKVAKTLARLLVQQKRAACVNIVPAVCSIYRWNDAIEEAEESMLIIKTQTACVPHVIELVQRHHPYDCPEIISTALGEGSAPYLEWIAQNTTPPSAP